MDINAADVKKLRDRTGLQMMKCKAALTEAGGDMDQAVEILRKKNKDVSENVSGRVMTEGRVAICIDAKTRTGAIVELLCESAPVAKNELFVKLADDIARQLVVKGVPASPDELLAQPFVDDPKHTVRDRITEVVGLMRENIKPRRMEKLDGVLGEYVHHDGTKGALLAVEGAQADAQMLRDVCMHIVAQKPLTALREHIPQDRIDKEMEIARAQAQEQGKDKPANIVEKIAEGKLRAWVADKVLVEQPFVRDSAKTVGQVLQAAGLKVKQFVRFQLDEVAS